MITRVCTVTNISLLQERNPKSMLVVEKYHLPGLFCIMWTVITPEHSPWEHSDDFCGMLYIHLNWYQQHFLKKMHYKAISWEATMMSIKYKTYMLTWLNLNLNFGRGKKTSVFLIACVLTRTIIFFCESLRRLDIAICICNC